MEASKLNPLALGGAFGVAFGLYVLFIGIAAMYGWGVSLVNAISTLYIGYSASAAGAVIGFVWAFTDSFIAGFIIALLYNFFMEKCPLCKKS